MSNKTHTPTTTKPEEQEYIANTEDAAEDAAHKLVVAINLLKIETDRRLDDDDDGGYGLSEAIRILDDIRTDLRKSVAKAVQDRNAETKPAGGAQ
ncbi:MAG: hypothetical protein WBC51_17410 [Vicinamibacterales bacterium]